MQPNGAEPRRRPRRDALPSLPGHCAMGDGHVCAPHAGDGVPLRHTPGVYHLRASHRIPAQRLRCAPDRTRGAGIMTRPCTDSLFVAVVAARQLFLCGRNSCALVLSPTLTKPALSSSPPSTAAVADLNWSQVACGGIGGLSGSVETSSTVARSADSASRQTLPSSSGSLTETAFRPRAAANAAKSTSGRTCDSTNFGAPAMAHISQVTWLRSLLCRTATIRRGSSHCCQYRLMVISSAMPFICMAPSPENAITGRWGWANFAPIAYGTAGPIVARLPDSEPRMPPRKRRLRAYQFAAARESAVTMALSGS